MKQQDFGANLPIQFVENESAVAGNTQSAHEVRFGQLAGFGDVAVKMFSRGLSGEHNSNHEKATHEHRMYKLLESLGHLTLDSLGVVDGNNGSSFLVTRRIPKLRSLASLDLSKNDSAVEGVISDVSVAIAGIHNDGITHGDAKPRNFSILNQNPSGIYVVDLEGAQKFVPKHQESKKQQSNRAIEYFMNRKRSDLSTLGFTLGLNGYGQDLSMLEAAELVKETLLVPYKSKLDNPEGFDESSITERYLKGLKKFNKFQTGNERTEKAA